MAKGKLINSLLAFSFTLLLFTAVVFAWWTLQETASVDPLVVQVTDVQASVEVEVSKNGGGFETLESVEEFKEFFENAIPSDKFEFRITIENKSLKNVAVRVTLYDLESTTSNVSSYDMRNVFYLENGEIFVDNVLHSTLTGGPTPTVHDQVLNEYNLNNLINYKEIRILEETPLTLSGKIVVGFTIVYDEETEKMGYQEGVLTIGSINVYID